MATLPQTVSTVGIAVAFGLLILFGLLALTTARGRIRREALAEERGRDLDERLAELVRLQAETTGRMRTMAEIFGTRQSDLARGLSERLDGLSHHLGDTLATQGRATHENLSRLAERLAVIDRAQRGMAELSGEVVQLRSILANKQARGAFGQGRMEAIVADALPADAYAFQATLSTGGRPDCLIRMGQGAPDLAIDAKFPLEAWTAFHEAADDEARDRAAQGFRRDVLRHVGDVATKYLLPAETQDVAFLFVPSESIFADLHEHFDDVIQRAHRARVVIVSPSLLTLAIQVVRSITRDQRMREQAHVIQAEVAHLLDDVARLSERVAKLQTHFGQAARDLDQIAVSADKVERRASRIESLDLGTAALAPAAAGPGEPVLPFDRTRLAGE
ncbi:MAG: DNA recombination protein RmuC [Siculibacillus sp.]|nr:DNA recombination protein RmuC [Siculibacillus sp.]